MISTIQRLGFLALVVVLCFSCEKDDDVAEQTQQHDCPKEEKDDCVPYVAQSFSDGLTDSWSVANEKDTFSALITIPATELGGGVVTVSLETQGSATPSMSVWESTLVGQGGSIFTSGEADKKLFTGKFTAHPGKSYTVIVHPFFNDDTYPSSYDISWSYEGKMDCYEMNDNQPNAKFIPKDKDIEAYILAGHVKNNVGSLDENTFDWYKIVLDDPSYVEVLLDKCPADILMTTRIFDEDEKHQLSTASFITGSSTEAGSTYTARTNRVLPAGTYWIEMHSFFAPETDIVKDEIEPEHWNTPYSFKVYAVE